MYYIEVATFEEKDTEPVVIHTFIGYDRSDAQGLLKEHSRQDEFLRASLTGEDYKGIKLSSEIKKGER